MNSLPGDSLQKQYITCMQCVLKIVCSSQYNYNLYTKLCNNIISNMQLTIYIYITLPQQLLTCNVLQFCYKCLYYKNIYVFPSQYYSTAFTVIQYTHFYLNGVAITPHFQENATLIWYTLFIGTERSLQMYTAFFADY